jgi:Peptidase family M1 domain
VRILVSLFCYAECDYTRLMRFRLALVAFLIMLPLSLRASSPVPTGTDSSPRETLALLNALRLDNQSVYTVSTKDHIEIRQADVTLYFTEGRIAFFQPFEGRITGFVFSGLGHALALSRDPVEKQQLARFLGTPVLDQPFVSAYVRFTNDTAKDLLDQLQHAGVTPATDNGFVALWRPQLERLNPTHSIRILMEKYYSDPRHFFHAGIDGITTGPFDVLLDNSRAENVLIGQPRRTNYATFYDVWSSYTLPGSTPLRVPFNAVGYHVDTVIQPDNSLVGSTVVDFRALAGTEQVLFVQLARSLKVESISLDHGSPLSFFQNEGLTEQDLRTRGDDTICVFLPKTPAAGESFSLHFRYRGNVITDAGNGVLYVGARESWYPHFGDASQFALYELSFRWPKRLRLVATGEKSEEHEDGEFRNAQWKTAIPVPEAGFNLGEYAQFSVTTGDRTVDVYANRQLEQAILARIAPPAADFDINSRLSPGEAPITPHSALRSPAPSPADALKQLAREIDGSIRFYEQYSGPFPFRHLGVSQIPGTFGQGWPGLLYLSTLSFLPQQAQARAGLNETGQEQFTDIVPFHEVAHQWWGNVVGWSSYHDQWLSEAVASYYSLLFANSQKNSERPSRAWLDRYRKRLATKSSNEEIAAVDVGPLTLGSRLTSSKSPDAYEVIVYSKGAWVIHMLHEMLRQPNSPDPDARFTKLMRTIETKYAQAPLSTAQFQREVEAVMTPKMDLEGGRSMDWFFDQYVKGTGIPHYKVEFTTRRTEKGFQVRGKLLQSQVPHSFIAPVPLYLNAGLGRTVLLGTVLALGEETPFTFTAQTEPHKLLIDPHMTLLCVAE